MTRGILFCNGDMKPSLFYRNFIREDDFLIAVDGGGRHCDKLGLTPHLILGDFDSLPLALQKEFDKKNVEKIFYPPEKDYTDLALAIEIALERNFDSLIILGAFGGKRIDMELSNILLLSRYNKKISMVDENRTIEMIREGEVVSIAGWQGEYLSLLPLTTPMITGKSKGLKYPLEDLVFSFGESRSLSNEFIAEYSEVSIKKGSAFLICQRK